MKIIYMGTPEFAVPPLEALINAGHEILCVFTRPDMPRDRGQKIKMSPVKQAALAHNIEVFQPKSLKKGEDAQKSLDLIKRLAPDVIIVAAYGQILPKEIMDIPRFGCVNIHASLLPRWRGASPINMCVMHGDSQSGVTIMQMDEGIDTGDMLLWEACAAGSEITVPQLHDRLMEIGARLIVKFAEDPAGYIERRTPQDHAKATHAPLITKNMEKIDPGKPAAQVRDFIRGMAGRAYMFLGDKRLKAFASSVVEGSGADYELTVLDIVCGDNKILRLTQVQLEGKSKMSAEDFLRGYK